MNQSNLNRAVARATGETVDRIHRMGFSLLIVPPCVRRPRDKTTQQSAKPNWRGLLRLKPPALA